MKRITVRGFLTREPAEDAVDSYASLRASIEGALAAGEQLVLDFDSGGGDAIGVRELAEFIFRNRERIEGYISGTCGSAAYYLASACGKLTAAEDAVIGSIGSMVFPPFRGDAIVASLSALKNTSSGLQEIVNEACERFIVDVAKYRGLSGTPEELSKQMGEGALFSARTALNKGLIDGVKTMDDQNDQSQLDVEGVAAMLPKVLEKLDELARKIDAVDERVGMLERDEHELKAEEEQQAEEPQEACKPKSAEGEEEQKKDEDEDKMQGVVDCLIETLKRQGNIPANEESRAVRLLDRDFSLFKDIYVKRSHAELPSAKMSLSAKASTEPKAATRSDRAKQYMKLAGCSYVTALAHVMEQE